MSLLWIFLNSFIQLKFWTGRFYVVCMIYNYWILGINHSSCQALWNVSLPSLFVSRIKLLTLLRLIYGRCQGTDITEASMDYIRVKSYQLKLFIKRIDWRVMFMYVFSLVTSNGVNWMDIYTYSWITLRIVRSWW